MIRHRGRKEIRTMPTSGHKEHILKCTICKQDTKADIESVAVICSTCTMKRLPLDAEMKRKLHMPVTPDVKGLRKRGRPVGSKNGVRKPKPLSTGKRGRPKSLNPKPVSKFAGFGRGWHLKKKFKAPDGHVYSFGKKVK